MNTAYVATEKGLGQFEEMFGIQKELATHICKDMFTNNIAKMTLEFPKPKVQEIVKDIKFTFPDMLGTVGE